MEEHDAPSVMNLGNGKGFSAFEIIDSVHRVTGKNIEYSSERRREGDPPTLMANSALVREALKWEPVFADIDSIIESAWNFHHRQS